MASYNFMLALSFTAKEGSGAVGERGIASKMYLS